MKVPIIPSCVALLLASGLFVAWSSYWLKFSAIMLVVCCFPFLFQSVVASLAIACWFIFVLFCFILIVLLIDIKGKKNTLHESYAIKFFVVVGKVNIKLFGS